MVTGLIKFSDERNKKYSIKTIVDKRNLVPVVKKECIFEEGKEHLRNIFNNQSKLKKYFPNVEICPAKLTSDNILEFEYLDGISLENEYFRAAKEKNEILFEILLEKHREIIIGSLDNQCEFIENVQFNNLFGKADAYISKKALRFSNFDAIPSNIIYVDGKPNFIDYEWVMDFIMPLDLVIYNCIDNLYLKNRYIDDFYPEKKAFKLLGIETDINVLKESYQYFFNRIISEDNGTSYIKNKISCLKPKDTISSIRIEWQKCADEWKKAVAIVQSKDEELSEARREWQKCADEWKKVIDVIHEKDEELTKVNHEWAICADEWKKSVRIIEEKERELAETRKEWEICADEWKKSVCIIDAKEKEIAEIRQEWSKCASEWKKAVCRVNELEKEKNNYKDSYEQIVNSKRWKLLSKINNVKKRKENDKN